jgi:hypothetical protein
VVAVQTTAAPPPLPSVDLAGFAPTAGAPPESQLLELLQALVARTKEAVAQAYSGEHAFLSDAGGWLAGRGSAAHSRLCALPAWLVTRLAAAFTACVRLAAALAPPRHAGGVNTATLPPSTRKRRTLHAVCDMLNAVEAAAAERIMEEAAQRSKAARVRAWLSVAMARGRSQRIGVVAHMPHPYTHIPTPCTPMTPL